MRLLYQKLVRQSKYLRNQLFFACFLMFALFFGAVCALLLTAVRGMLIDQIGGSRLDVLRQIAERANSIKSSSITLLNLYDYEINAGGYPDGTLDAAGTAQAAAELDSQKQMYDQVFRHTGLGYEAVLLNRGGFEYCSDKREDPRSIEQQLWYRRLLAGLEQAQPGEVRFSRTFGAEINGERVYRFAAGQLLRDGDDPCVLLVLIDERTLEELYAAAQSPGSEIYIYDQDGFIVSHSNKRMLGKQFIDVAYMRERYGVDSCDIVTKLGESYLLTTCLDEETGWTIVEEIPTRAIFGALNRLYLMIGGVLFCALALGAAVSLGISRRVSRPLTELSRAMDAFGSRDFTALKTDTGTCEIDHLRASFNHMAQEIFHLMDAVQEREAQRRVLEMNFLRAQINPHFLYNMLFSIRCTVEIGKDEQAVQMITAFTDLLRSTLAVKGDSVPLEEELESIRKYLVVQKLRYGERFNYEIDMQEGTEDCRIPPLILQPLVENAIFHGLEAKPGADTVVVSSTLEGKDLLLTVADDGAGMDPETLARVMERCRRTQPKGTDSIGLSNVHNRIRLNYGSGYGLTLESSPGIGTTAILRMPAICPQEKGAHDEGSDR